MTKKISLREYFVTGIFAVLPMLFTVWVAMWLLELVWTKFFSLLVPGVDWIITNLVSAETDKALHGYHVNEAIGLLLLLGLIVAIGFVARRFIGKSLLALLDKVIDAIPGINFIYSTIRQFTSTMDPDSPQRDAFRHAVLAKIGSAQVLGFMTSQTTIQGKGGRPYVTVFLPCNQLIQGYNLIVPRADVTELDMKVDDAIKFVVSFGMVAPGQFRAKKKRPSR